MKNRNLLYLISHFKIKSIGMALCITFLMFHSFSQNPNWLWAKSAGGIDGDAGRSICSDLIGNVFVTGVYNAPTISFGSITLTNAGGGADIFIVKYDSLGNTLWAKSVGGTGSDGSYSITTDASGNVLVTGFFMSPTITFGSTTLTNTGSSDVFIVKYDPSGNLLWVNSVAGISQDNGSSIATDANKNVIVTGYFKSPSISFGTDTLNNSAMPYFDIFVVKYDSLGNFLWANSAQGNSSDFSYSTSVDGNSNIFLTGRYTSPTITFDTVTLNNAGSENIFVVKYDSLGNVIWAKTEGSTAFDGAYGISTDDIGNVLITGYFTSPSVTFGSITLSNASTPSLDMYVVKYNSSGNVLWAKLISGSWDEFGNGISTNSSGDVFVTGTFRSPSITIGSTILNNFGYYDMFVMKYDSLGNVMWAKSAGGSDYDGDNSIASTVAGDVLITGRFGSPSIIFDTTTLNTVGGTDIFVAKLRENTPTSIIETDKQEYVNIYPNPTSSNLFIKLNETQSNSSVQVIDIMGAMVFHEININNTSKEINLKNFPNGIYFVKVFNDAYSICKKIIVEHN